MKCTGGTESRTSVKEASKEMEIIEERRSAEKEKERSERRKGEKDVDDGNCIEHNEQ